MKTAKSATDPRERYRVAGLAVSIARDLVRASERGVVDARESLRRNRERLELNRRKLREAQAARDKAAKR